MAQGRPLSNVGSCTSFFAAFHSLAAAHTSNRLNHDLASPSSRGSGKHIVFPAVIVPGFGTTVIAQRTTVRTGLAQPINSNLQAHGQKPELM